MKSVISALSRCPRQSITIYSVKRSIHLPNCLHTPYRQIFEDIDQHVENKLSVEEVKSMLSVQEFKQTISHHPSVQSFSANQIGVNRPVEDRWNAGQFGGERDDYNRETYSGCLFNVIDGHAGPACAHAVNIRYMDYVSASLLALDLLERQYHWLRQSGLPSNTNYFLSHCYPHRVGYNPWGELPTEIKLAHHRQIMQFVSELLSSSLDVEVVHPRTAMHAALVRLESDLFSATMPTGSSTLCRAHVRAAMSGCVASIAYFPCATSELILAQTGDTGAVLGRLDDSSGQWSAELLIKPHNIDNESEVKRLNKSHPNEQSTVLREGRLLGQLSPLRAFGDAKFKWKAQDLKFLSTLLQLPPNYPVTPSHYYTPPYLICDPEIIRRPLQLRTDRFVILASDGLWDLVSPEEAVRVVAQCIQDTDNHSTAANALIQFALGGEKRDWQRIASILSIPANVARHYRDDITVLVVHFHQA